MEQWPRLKLHPLVRLDPVPLEEVELAALIDKLRREDLELRRLGQRILRLQRQLRARLDAETWKVYLAVEEAVNERGFRMLLLTTKRLRRRAR